MFVLISLVCMFFLYSLLDENDLEIDVFILSGVECRDVSFDSWRAVIRPSWKISIIHNSGADNWPSALCLGCTLCAPLMSWGLAIFELGSDQPGSVIKGLLKAFSIYFPLFTVHGQASAWFSAQFSDVRYLLLDKEKPFSLSTQMRGERIDYIERRTCSYAICHVYCVHIMESAHFWCHLLWI